MLAVPTDVDADAFQRLKSDRSAALNSVFITWDNKIFATRTNSEFVKRPVLHIVFVDLWSTGRLPNADFVLVTNVFLSRVSGKCGDF